MKNTFFTIILIGLLIMALLQVHTLSGLKPIKSDTVVDTTAHLTFEQKLSAYNAKIRYSNNADTILFYKQKRELLLFKQKNYESK